MRAALSSFSMLSSQPSKRKYAAILASWRAVCSAVSSVARKASHSFRPASHSVMRVPSTCTHSTSHDRLLCKELPICLLKSLRTFPARHPTV